jgi:hypothetical protein
MRRALHRPICVFRQEAGPPLQREGAGRHNGDRGRPPPAGLAVEMWEKLAQPSMGVARQPGRQASDLGSGSYNHRSIVAQEAMVRTPIRDVHRDHGHAP